MGERALDMIKISPKKKKINPVGFYRKSMKFALYLRIETTW